MQRIYAEVMRIDWKKKLKKGYDTKEPSKI